MSFKEYEHPRDTNGRFVSKNAVDDQSLDELAKEIFPHLSREVKDASFEEIACGIFPHLRENETKRDGLTKPPLDDIMAAGDDSPQNRHTAYQYVGTAQHIRDVISSLPANGASLLSKGWEDISHPLQAACGSFVYKETSTGLRIRFDVLTSDAFGFKGRNHYHILNPSATCTRDLYLDASGKPVAKNSKASHILPKGEEQP